MQTFSRRLRSLLTEATETRFPTWVWQLEQPYTGYAYWFFPVQETTGAPVYLPLALYAALGRAFSVSGIEGDPRQAGRLDPSAMRCFFNLMPACGIGNAERPLLWVWPGEVGWFESHVLPLRRAVERFVEPQPRG